MSNLTIKIVDTKTGEVIVRDMNKEELEQRKQESLVADERQQQAAQKAEARSAAEAKLLALGLTVEDLKALLG